MEPSQRSLGVFEEGVVLAAVLLGQNCEAQNTKYFLAMGSRKTFVYCYCHLTLLPLLLSGSLFTRRLGQQLPRLGEGIPDSCCLDSAPPMPWGNARKVDYTEWKLCHIVSVMRSQSSDTNKCCKGVIFISGGYCSKLP